MKRMRTRLMIGAGAALAVAGGGAALAASQGTPAQESQAIIEDAAKQLGVDSAKLSDALQQALENRVDEAVADGRLTEEQGKALKARIGSAGFPLLGLRGGHGPGGHDGRGGHLQGPGLEAAATFFGVTEAELRESLAGGATLAEVAKAEGKTVAGLVDALVAAETAKLAEAVEDGRLTDAQRDAMFEGLRERVTERVNGTAPKLGRGPGLGGHGFRGAPHEAPPAGESGYRFSGGAGPPAAA